MCKPVVEQWKGEVMTQCVGAAGWLDRVMIEHGRVGDGGREALANVGLPLADGFGSNCGEACLKHSIQRGFCKIPALGKSFGPHSGMYFPIHLSSPHSVRIQ